MRNMLSTIKKLIVFFAVLTTPLLQARSSDEKIRANSIAMIERCLTDEVKKIFTREQVAQLNTLSNLSYEAIKELRQAVENALANEKKKDPSGVLCFKLQTLSNCLERLIDTQTNINFKKNFEYLINTLLPSCQKKDQITFKDFDELIECVLGLGKPTKSVQQHDLQSIKQKVATLLLTKPRASLQQGTDAYKAKHTKSIYIEVIKDIFSQLEETDVTAEGAARLAREWLAPAYDQRAVIKNIPSLKPHYKQFLLVWLDTLAKNSPSSQVSLTKTPPVYVDLLQELAQIAQGLDTLEKQTTITYTQLYDTIKETCLLTKPKCKEYTAALQRYVGRVAKLLLTKKPPTEGTKLNEITDFAGWRSNIVTLFTSLEDSSFITPQALTSLPVWYIPAASLENRGEHTSLAKDYSAMVSCFKENKDLAPHAETLAGELALRVSAYTASSNDNANRAAMNKPISNFNDNEEKRTDEKGKQTTEHLCTTDNILNHITYEQFKNATTNNKYQQIKPPTGWVSTASDAVELEKMDQCTVPAENINPSSDSNGNKNDQLVPYKNSPHKKRNNKPLRKYLAFLVAENGAVYAEEVDTPSKKTETPNIVDPKIAKKAVLFGVAPAAYLTSMSAKFSDTNGNKNDQLIPYKNSPHKKRNNKPLRKYLDFLVAEDGTVYAEEVDTPSKKTETPNIVDPNLAKKAALFGVAPAAYLTSMSAKFFRLLQKVIKPIVGKSAAATMLVNHRKKVAIATGAAVALAAYGGYKLYKKKQQAKIVPVATNNNPIKQKGWLLFLLMVCLIGVALFAFYRRRK